MFGLCSSLVVALSLAGLSSADKDPPASNCTGGDTNVTYLKYLNATGSVNTTGWDLQGTGTNVSAGVWTWSIGMATTEVKGKMFKYEIEQRIWLQTSPPQDLMAAGSKFSGCVYVLQDWNPDLQKQAQKDNGDCSSFLNKDCIAAIRRDAAAAVKSPPSKNNKCPRFSVPKECRTAIGDFWPGADSTEFINATYPDDCKPSGSGTMNEGYIMAQYRDEGSAPIKGNLEPYDRAVTGITMLVPVILYGSPATLNDSRVACVRPKSFNATSRHPTDVPDYGVRVAVASALLVWAAPLVVAAVVMLV